MVARYVATSASAVTAVQLDLLGLLAPSHVLTSLLAAIVNLDLVSVAVAEHLGLLVVGGTPRRLSLLPRRRPARFDILGRLSQDSPSWSGVDPGVSGPPWSIRDLRPCAARVGRRTTVVGARLTSTKSFPLTDSAAGPTKEGVV